MILTGPEIERQVELGRITVRRFARCNVTTNSVDVHLGTRILRYTCSELDPKRVNDYELVEIQRGGLPLGRGQFVLAETEETIGSDFYVPLIHARSSVARLGLFVHVTADLIDIGYCGRITLQLFATLPVRLYPHMKIAQVTFWCPQGRIELYRGKYQGLEGPCASLSYRDFGEQ